jgi:hypothetical protein
MMLRARVLTVFLVIILIFGISDMCGKTNGNGDGYSDLNVRVETDKDVYSVGEPVYIEITLENSGPESVTLGFSSSCHSSYKVYDTSDKLIYRPLQGCLCIMTTLTIKAHSSVEWNYTWNQVDEHNEQVPGGEYKIIGFILEYDYIGEDERAVRIIDYTLLMIIGVFVIPFIIILIWLLNRRTPSTK